MGFLGADKVVTTREAVVCPNTLLPCESYPTGLTMIMRLEPFCVAMQRVKSVQRNSPSLQQSLKLVRYWKLYFRVLVTPEC